MDGIITSFRRGIRTQKKYQMLVRVKGVETREKAKTLVDKNVSWKTSSGKEIKGKVTNIHGNSGILRVQFEKGMPGQSLGQKVKLE